MAKHSIITLGEKPQFCTFFFDAKSWLIAQVETPEVLLEWSSRIFLLQLPRQERIRSSGILCSHIHVTGMSCYCKWHFPGILRQLLNEVGCTYGLKEDIKQGSYPLILIWHGMVLFVATVINGADSTHGRTSPLLDQATCRAHGMNAWHPSQALAEILGCLVPQLPWMLWYWKIMVIIILKCHLCYGLLHLLRWAFKEIL